MKFKIFYCQLEHNTYGFSFWEGDISLSSNSQQVLETVDDRVWYGGNSWVSYLQTDGCNVADTLHELGTDVVISDVQNLWAEDSTLVVNCREKIGLK